jgi:hypothetical protein
MVEERFDHKVTMTAQPMSRIHRQPGWLQGAAVGLTAAIAGSLALITVGAIGGRGLAILDAVVMTGWRAMGRFDGLTWQSVLIAHVVANVVLLTGILWVHPSLRSAFRRAYQD